MLPDVFSSKLLPSRECEVLNFLIFEDDSFIQLIIPIYTICQERSCDRIDISFLCEYFAFTLQAFSGSGFRTCAWFARESVGSGGERLLPHSQAQFATLHPNELGVPPVGPSVAAIGE